MPATFLPYSAARASSYVEPYQVNAKVLAYVKALADLTLIRPKFCTRVRYATSRFSLWFSSCSCFSCHTSLLRGDMGFKRQQCAQTQARGCIIATVGSMPHWRFLIYPAAGGDYRPQFVRRFYRVAVYSEDKSCPQGRMLKHGMVRVNNYPTSPRTERDYEC